MQSRLETSLVTVLYVEDDENDAFFMHRAFAQAAPRLHLKTVTAAVDILYNATPGFGCAVAFAIGGPGRDSP
jgi:hypothetical protein